MFGFPKSQNFYLKKKKQILPQTSVKNCGFSEPAFHLDQWLHAHCPGIALLLHLSSIPCCLNQSLCGISRALFVVDQSRHLWNIDFTNTWKHVCTLLAVATWPIPKVSFLLKGSIDLDLAVNSMTTSSHRTLSNLFSGKDTEMLSKEQNWIPWKKRSQSRPFFISKTQEPENRTWSSSSNASWYRRSAPVENSLKDRKPSWKSAKAKNTCAVSVAFASKQKNIPLCKQRAEVNTSDDDVWLIHRTYIHVVITVVDSGLSWLRTAVTNLSGKSLRTSLTSEWWQLRLVT